MLPREMLERSVIHMSLKGLGLWVPEPGEKTVIGAFLSALTSALSFIRQETETCSRAERSQSCEPEMNKRTTVVSYRPEKKILDIGGRKMGLPRAPVKAQP